MSIISLSVSITTSIIYRKKYKKNTLINTNPDVRLIFQSVITSIFYLLHNVFYPLAATFRAKQNEDAQNKYGYGYVIFYICQFMAFPIYHFSAFFFLFFFL